MPLWLLLLLTTQHLLTYQLLLHTMPQHQLTTNQKSTMSPQSHMPSNMVFLMITPEITLTLKKPKMAMLLAGHTKFISPTAVAAIVVRCTPGVAGL